MSRNARILTLIFGTLGFVALGSAYAIGTVGAQLTGLRYNLPQFLDSRIPRIYLTGLAIVLALTIIVTSIVHAVRAADDSTPRLLIPHLAFLGKKSSSVRTRLRDMPLMLRGAALLLGFVALLRPQSVEHGETTEDRGIDIVIALDVSESMRALLEVGDSAAQAAQTHQASSGRQTRLATAKGVILDFVSRRRSDRIGVVVFGVSAFILSPPTLDKALLSGLIDKMELGLVDGSATAIGDALGTSVARLRRSKARSKVVILLTDGDSNAGAVAPQDAARLADGERVRVYTVQIGNGSDADVEVGRDFLGQPVFERRHYPVNPELLKSIAVTTGGEAYVASDRAALEKSMHRILDSLQKDTFDAASSTVHELFPLFLIPAVLLLALEVLVRAFLVRRVP